MINFIPTSKNPNQMFQVNINKQNCTIILTQKRTGLFFSLAVDDVFVIRSVLCENENPLVLYSYIKFVGNLYFIDVEGNKDPDYRGLGDRFILCYSDEI